MAACSYADGRNPNLPVDLEAANEHLRWNPYPREFGSQTIPPESPVLSPETERKRWEKLRANHLRRSHSEELVLQQWREEQLRRTRRMVEHYAEQLTRYHEGRVIVNDEKPGRSGLELQYWSARLKFYKAELQRLDEEDEKRSSRSVTPGEYPSEFFGETELDHARLHAENAARRLGSLPAGRSLLNAEDHLEEDEKSAMSLEYWRSKEKLYKAKYAALPKESALDRAMRHANTKAKKLSTFPPGKELLEAENHGASAADIEYWRGRQRYYNAEYIRLRTEFWDRRRDVYHYPEPTHAALRVHLKNWRPRRSKRIADLEGKKTRQGKKVMPLDPVRPQRASKSAKNVLKKTAKPCPVIKTRPSSQGKWQKLMQQPVPMLEKTRSGRRIRRPDWFCP
ncbi:hypothetical protein MMC07_001687 [Pseudocyphellaria aurata]|nr:hypothetical protein [Pseudocyphellaria aurata]